MDIALDDPKLYPTYDPELWAEAPSSDDRRRTTNGCESFHSHFNALFNSTHPNIFSFLQELKRYQLRVYIYIRTLDTVVPMPAKEQSKIDFVRAQHQKMVIGAISRKAYLKSIGLRLRAMKKNRTDVLPVELMPVL